MMKTKLAGLFAVTLMLAGCHNPVNSVENAQKEGQRNMVSDQRVVTDMGLSKSVSVVGVNTAMTPGGLLKVQVELLNRTKSFHRFSYRFEWFDLNGMQISGRRLRRGGRPDRRRRKQVHFRCCPHPGLQGFSLETVGSPLSILKTAIIMKNKIILPLIAAGAACITGCGTNAHYVETGGRESIVSVGKINDQDFIAAASAATSDLLASGVLDRVKNPPAVLAMSRIVNNTGQQIDIDLLTKKIRVGLLQSGKAVTTTTFGLGGQAEDPLAKGIQQQQEFMNDQKTTRLPDFTLSGKIIENTAKAGDTRQTTYSFQLSLTDQQGLAVWEGEKEITKQGTRNAVGF